MQEKDEPVVGVEDVEDVLIQIIPIDKAQSNIAVMAVSPLRYLDEFQQYFFHNHQWVHHRNRCVDKNVIPKKTHLHQLANLIILMVHNIHQYKQIHSHAHESEVVENGGDQAYEAAEFPIFHK